MRLVKTFSSTDIKESEKLVNAWSSENRNCLIVSCVLSVISVPALGDQIVFVFTVLYETPR